MPLVDLPEVKKTAINLLSMAGLAAKSGECAAAQDIYESTLNIHPNSSRLRREYAAFLLKPQDITYRDVVRSVKLAREAAGMAGRSPATLLVLATALVEAGTVDEAVSVADEIIINAKALDYYRTKAREIKIRLSGKNSQE